ncbi:M48 family metallopeptidase [Candidatus Gottesmanbacteria bacterium]|nr:M48 family metallopeptidase [Candidatus Gottesmanbacteria bacterium]MBI5451964.1 M48 family metallopeptidase [Candidatus Gottesmanbacteria bacterium]
MAFFTIFIATVAFILGSASGYGISWAGNALIISGLMSFGSYFWGDRLVLAMSGAKEADRKKDAELYLTVEKVAREASLPKPKVYVIEDDAPNAFATGRSPQHAVVCATRGILAKLTPQELEGVLAHEMSHIQNFDTRLMAIVAVLVGMIAFLSNWFMRMLWWGAGGRDREERGSFGAILMLLGVILALISPIIATVIQLSISRRREFLADASGALLTKNPDSLASALEKISKDRAVLNAATNATAHLFIVNPFKGKEFGIWFASLFDTHPPVEERIKILRSM